MSAAIKVTAEAVEKPEWKPNREVTLKQLQRIDDGNRGWPTCRACGQRVNRLDAYGLCSKTSDIHQMKRGLPVKKSRS